MTASQYVCDGVLAPRYPLLAESWLSDAGGSHASVTLPVECFTRAIARQRAAPGAGRLPGSDSHPGRAKSGSRREHGSERGAGG